MPVLRYVSCVSKQIDELELTMPYSTPGTAYKPILPSAAACSSAKAVGADEFTETKSIRSVFDFFEESMMWPSGSRAFRSQSVCKPLASSKRGKM